ncbi:hypothetical protein FISHEDRAFT_55907 [Fistulina hepatica ATCC 64428]|uniref:AAA-ATPase-like domain-containing protein n=1 Tax=Fistulina hepatica ATCC 64428 TaxID=1128425 RepID=A0A0D7ALF0_9AGAR|nr:hypothetical protein FISHEDRAFT_55907 [Fistulina hepatica ATCC 64428]
MPPMPIFSFYAIVHKDARFFAIENDKSLTLREVIDTVEAIHKRDCGCGHLVGPEAWVAGLLDDPIDDDASESSSSGSDSKSSSCHTSSSQGRRYLHPSDSVTDLTGPLVFSAVDDKSTRLPSLLLRCPRGCLHLPKRLGQTCFIQTCHAPLNLRLPEPSMCTFTSFTYRLGTIWADKTHAIDFLSGPGRYYSNRLPLIRRPSGFGKTTFVFMLMYYHDCLRACVAERLFPPTACWDPNAPEPNRHLVLYFDLSKVPLGPDFREQLIAYIREVIITFVDAYRDVLGLSESTEECVSELSSVGDFDILASLFYMIASHEETIYLVVDNYNAPRLATERLDPDGDSIETVDSCLRRIKAVALLGRSGRGVTYIPPTDNNLGITLYEAAAIFRSLAAWNPVISEDLEATQTFNDQMTVLQNFAQKPHTSASPSVTAPMHLLRADASSIFFQLFAHGELSHVRLLDETSGLPSKRFLSNSMLTSLLSYCSVDMRRDLTCIVINPASGAKDDIVPCPRPTAPMPKWVHEFVDLIEFHHDKNTEESGVHEPQKAPGADVHDDIFDWIVLLILADMGLLFAEGLNPQERRLTMTYHEAGIIAHAPRFTQMHIPCAYAENQLRAIVLQLPVYATAQPSLRLYGPPPSRVAAEAIGISWLQHALFTYMCQGRNLKTATTWSHTIQTYLQALVTQSFWANGASDSYVELDNGQHTHLSFNIVDLSLLGIQYGINGTLDSWPGPQLETFRKHVKLSATEELYYRNRATSRIRVDQYIKNRREKTKDYVDAMVNKRVDKKVFQFENGKCRLDVYFVVSKGSADVEIERMTSLSRELNIHYMLKGRDL